MRLLAGPSNAQVAAIEALRQRITVERKVLGYGANWAIFGEPDHVARELHRLHEAGFDGVAIDFINYLEELPYFVQEVIPRLERMGIRTPASSRFVAS